MPLPDTCPKCGERATNEQGKCVFCGTQVIHPQAIPLRSLTEKAKSNYKTACILFIVMGSIYIVIGLLASLIYHELLLGFLLNGFIALSQGVLLLRPVEVVQNYAKEMSLIRLILLFWILASLIPYFPIVKAVGFVLLALVICDGWGLTLMIRASESIPFA